MTMNLLDVNVLEYCDGPLLFTAKDPADRILLCCFLQTLPTGSEFVCVPVSQERLDEFLAGNLDLRGMYDQPEAAEFYKLVTNRGDAELVAVSTTLEDIDPWLLPAAGYFMVREDPPEETVRLRELDAAELRSDLERDRIDL